MPQVVQPRPQPLAIVHAIALMTSYVGAKLHLFSNNLVPTPNTILTDFVECVYTGYAAAAQTWSAAFYDTTGVAVVSGGETLFSQTGSTGDTCYGGYLTDSAGTLLLGSFLLDAPFAFVNSGDTLALILKLSATGGLGGVSPGP